MWASTDQLRQEMVSKINEIIDKVNEPVEMNSPLKRTDALDEKKEEIEGNWINCPNCFPGFPKTPEPKKEEPKSGTHVGILLGDDEGVENVTYDGKEIYSKEPKSTLRGDIKEILCEAMFLKPVYLDPTGNKDTDKIISLFKDTLLKEINNYDMHYEARDVIKNIIKNL